MTSAGAAAVGTDTTFMVVSAEPMREGIKSAVWLGRGTVVRCGCTMPGSLAERREKTSVMSATSSSGAKVLVTLSVSSAERTRRDIFAHDERRDGKRR